MTLGGSSIYSPHPLMSVCIFWNSPFRDCRQITLHAKRIFSVKQKSLHHPPVLNGQYQNGQNTNQNQMKNTCPFHIVFQVLKVRPTKVCKIEPDLLFSCCFYQLSHLQISFFTNFQNFIQLLLSVKKIFVTNFLF